jgi:hypothetical protein
LTYRITSIIILFENMSREVISLKMAVDTAFSDDDIFASLNTGVSPQTVLCDPKCTLCRDVAIRKKSRKDRGASQNEKRCGYLNGKKVYSGSSICLNPDGPKLH